MIKQYWLSPMINGEENDIAKTKNKVEKKPQRKCINEAMIISREKKTKSKMDDQSDYIEDITAT